MVGNAPDKLRSLKLAITAEAGAVHRAYLHKHLRRAQVHLPRALETVSLAMVGNRRMADLHHRYLGIPGPTDVLTFELDHDTHGHALSGEVVICVPHARRQARPLGVPLQRELLLYALHGMLHLCGLDDRTAAGFAAMHRKEDEILTALGVGPVFHPAPAASTVHSRYGAPKPAKRMPPGLGAR